MDKKTFIDTLNCYTGITFKEEGERIIVKVKKGYNLSLNGYSYGKYLETIPENVTFEGEGHVQMSYLKDLPDSTLFINDGDVYLGNNTLLSKTYKGFQHTGNLSPENPKFKKPIPQFRLSNSFIGFLNEFHTNPISKFLLEKNNSGRSYNKFDGSFIDLSMDKSETITYLPNDKTYKLYMKYLKETENSEIENGKIYLNLNRVPLNFANWAVQNFQNLVNDKSKTSVKIGRFIKAIRPETTDKEIETFVNKYKSMKTLDDYEFEIVRGEEIHKYYNRANQDCPTSSSLYGSCRNYTDVNDIKYKYCNFYSSTPETCGLLILRYKGETKIRGRAFVWNTNDGKVFLDRVYTANVAEAALYNEYAKKNGYLQGSSAGITINVNKACRNVNPALPYLDSFTYDRNKDIISR